ncbi:MAG: hypothetical protein KC733_02685, partial [Candidatus Omnitrophica bacterium]|nr:hypothetical protein [Candidatus Omnitrophota bacterium]
MPLINFPHKKRKSNRSGVILIAVLWVLVILTMLTTSIGRNTSIELSLTKYAIARLQAKYLAWGGLVYAMNQIRQDSQHEEFKAYDTLYSCAIVTDEDSASKDIFS